MFQRRDERMIILFLLVPPPVFRGEDRTDEHLVDWSEELHPGEALGKFSGIIGKQPRKIWILEITEPVRNAEVAEVDDGRDVAAFEVRER